MNHFDYMAPVGVLNNHFSGFSDHWPEFKLNKMAEDLKIVRLHMLHMFVSIDSIDATISVATSVWAVICVEILGNFLYTNLPLELPLTYINPPRLIFNQHNRGTTFNHFIITRTHKIKTLDIRLIYVRIF